MVIGFSSFGYLVYILSRAYADESHMVAVFRRYFPYMVAPQILMLAYAIYLRIAQYDLTMNRYFVVIFGIWLTIISLYYILSSAKSLSMIPASLVSAILIISVGPWSVYSVPQVRQEARLVRNLETAKILQE
jgi:low temperature requirement protein LtrA